MLRNAQNPKELAVQIAMQNPQMKTIMDQANALYKGDMNAYFKAECAKHGMSEDQMNAFLTNFAAAMNTEVLK